MRADRRRSLRRPLELLDREGQGGGDVRDATELDRELCRGDRVRRLEDRHRVRFPEEPEELLEDDVRGHLRMLEHPGRLFKLAPDHPELVHQSYVATRAQIRAALFNHLAYHAS